MADKAATTIDSIAAAAGAAAEDRVWLDVINKMDEVYNDLLKYEVALEEKNAALEDSQQFISSVLTSMSDILIVCSRAGIIESVNQSLLTLTGKNEEDLRGRPIFDLFADEASRQNAQRHFTGHPAERLNDCELQIASAEGAPVPVSMNCTPRYSAMGKLLGMVVTGRPVGELQRAYQALHRAHEELKHTQQQLLHSEKMASLGRLVAGVAHELNNPISFVLGNTVVLKKYAKRIGEFLEAAAGDLPTAERERLRKELRIDRILADLPSLIDGTVEGAERTRDIVDGLKRFSAVDRDERERFDLVPVIERAVHWVGKASPDRFKVAMELGIPIMVTGSPGQLQQVVMNLAQNAADATAGLADARLAIAARASDGWVEIEFRDNGPGIAAENLGRIFDPFFTTKPVGKGTGLGLAISYGIVDRHGGKLSAYNHADGGAVFSLLLPLT
ncbi:MAG: ATP-binding protein [Sterolibacteriaceae bacterium MAG5]|nr:ATP-binding protein [Candidatus Nitricoxidireducens bremensis]